MSNNVKLESQRALTASVRVNVTYASPEEPTGFRHEALAIPSLPCSQLAILRKDLLRDFSLQSCDIRSPLNLQKTNSRDSIKLPKISELNLATSGHERTTYRAAFN
jgi:hypothetical protein